MGNRIIKAVTFREIYGLAKITVSRKFYGALLASHLPALYHKNNSVSVYLHYFMTFYFIINHGSRTTTPGTTTRSSRAPRTTTLGTTAPETTIP